MNIIRLVLIGLVLTGASVHSAVNRWTSVQPYGGGQEIVYCVAIAPSSPDVVYLGASGVYRSTDSRQHFWAGRTALDQDTVRCLAVHPLDPATVVAGSEGGLFRSDDGGDSWRNLAPPEIGALCYVAVLFDPANPDTLFAAGNADEFGRGRIMRSGDGGQTWTTLWFGEDVTVYSLAASPTAFGLLYAASSAGVFRSTNGGAAWQRVMDSTREGFTVHSVVMDPRNPAVVYATGGSTLRRSIDGGYSWHEVFGPVDVTVLAIDPTPSGKCYALSPGQGIYQSLDGGLQWALLAADLKDKQAYDMAIEFGPSDRIYVLTWAGLWGSVDSGGTWSLLENEIALSSLEWPDSYCAASPTALFFGAGSDGYVSSDRGTNWTRTQIADGVSKVWDWGTSVQDPTLVYAGTNQGLYQSRDAGGNWTPCAAMAGRIRQVKIDPNNPRIVYAAGDGGVALRWVDRSDNEDGFLVWRQTGNGVWTMIGNTSPGATWFRDQGFDPAAITSYQVAAFNLDGLSESCPSYRVSPANRPPATPTLLPAVVLASNQIELEWVRRSAVETRYYLWRQVDGGRWLYLGVTEGQTTTYIDSTVNLGKNYCYRLVAYNEAGTSGMSNTVCATTSLHPPKAPDRLSAMTVSPRRIDVQWGGDLANADGFTLWRQRGEEDWVRIAKLGREARRYTDRSVTENTWYAYGVRAFNTDGISEGSPIAWAFVPISLDPPPASTLQASVADGKVELTWDCPGVLTEGFVLWRQIWYSDWETIATLPATATSYTDAAIVQGARYSYGLRAYNAYGSSESSNIVTVEVPATAPPPAPHLQAEVVSHNGAMVVSLLWYIAPGVSEGFSLWRMPAGGEMALIAQTGADVRTYLDAAVAENTWYCYSLRAFNAYGVSPSSPNLWVLVKRQPGSPQGFQALVNAEALMTLSWQNGADPLEGRRLWRARGDSAETLMATLAPSVNSIQEEKPAPGIREVWRLEAFNDNESASAQVEVYQPEPAAPGYTGAVHLFCGQGIGRLAPGLGGTVWTIQSLNQVIQLDAEGRVVSSWDLAADTSHFEGIAADALGNVYLSDIGSDRVLKYGPDGRLLAAWGGSGQGEGQFAHPSALGCDPDGSLYVYDSGNRRIQKFTLDGGFVRQWGSDGWGEGQFSGWTGASIAFNSGKDVYVTDSWHCRVQKFTPDGEFLTKWGAWGDAAGEFLSLGGVAVDTSGRVLVTDRGTRKVLEYWPDGVFHREWGGSELFPAATDIVVSADGQDVWVADGLSVHRFRQLLGP